MDRYYDTGAQMTAAIPKVSPPSTLGAVKGLDRPMTEIENVTAQMADTARRLGEVADRIQGRVDGFMQAGETGSAFPTHPARRRSPARSARSATTRARSRRRPTACRPSPATSLASSERHHHRRGVMAKAGHNSGKGGPISADRLKSFIERIEKMIAERDAINGDIKDIYSEAKGVGYDVKTMRKVIQLRGMDAADRAEQEALLATYLHALGMVDRIDARLAAGESQRAIAAAEGVSKSTVQRRGPKVVEFPASSKMDHPEPEDGDDGITETQEGLGPNAVPEETNQPPQAAPPAIESCGGVESRHAAEAGKARDQRTATGAPGSVGGAVSLGRVSAAGQMRSGVTVPAAGVAPGPHDASLDLAHNEVQPTAPVSVGAVARPSSDERVAPNNPVLTPHVTTDEEALAAMDAAYEALQEARARRPQTQEAGV